MKKPRQLEIPGMEAPAPLGMRRRVSWRPRVDNPCRYAIPPKSVRCGLEAAAGTGRPGLCSLHANGKQWSGNP